MVLGTRVWLLKVPGERVGETGEAGVGSDTMWELTKGCHRH